MLDASKNTSSRVNVTSCYGGISAGGGAVVIDVDVPYMKVRFGTQVPN
jgi:hypothetical protein